MRLALVFMLIWACGLRAEETRTITLEGVAQGTTYHIKFVKPAGAFDQERLHQEVEKELAEIDRQMSTYRADSEISRFNRAPAGKWFEVSRGCAEVVAASRAISEKTGGAQDVTVGPLVRLWHFGGGNKSGDAKTQAFKPPLNDEIRAARKLVGYTKLEVRTDSPALRKQIDGLDVDLSSIASGYTIDRLAGIIRDHGVKNFIVELGGELRAAGRRADGSPWRVAIERPLASKRELEMAVPLVDTSMATAGGSRHFFEYAGKRYSHIIDPATGRPVAHTLASVTVAADTCIEADGWDTPLLVLGPERGGKCAEKHGIAAMFIVHTNEGDAISTTTAWRKRYPSESSATSAGSR
jgi:FAD:protein FMN transferase